MEENCLTFFSCSSKKHSDRSNLRGAGLLELPVPGTVHHGGESIAAGKEGMVAEADCGICMCLGFILPKCWLTGMSPELMPSTLL